MPRKRHKPEEIVTKLRQVDGRRHERRKARRLGLLRVGRSCFRDSGIFRQVFERVVEACNGIEHKIPDHSAFSRARNERSA